MLTPETQKAVEKQLCETKKLVQDYEARADKFWFFHQGIGVLLIFEVIVEMVFQDKIFVLASEMGLKNPTVFILITIPGVTIALDFVSNLTRRAEISEFVSMECSIVEVELKGLLDDIENHSDEEVRAKCRELAWRMAAIMKWEKEATMWRYLNSIFRVKPSPPPPSASTQER